MSNYSIDSFLGDAFGFCPAHFGVLFCSVVLSVDPWQYYVCCIRCNPVHPLNGALPGPFVPVRVTRGALVAHRYTYVQPRCRTLQYRITFILLSVSFWNDLASPVFDGVGLAGFKSRANAF